MVSLTNGPSIMILGRLGCLYDPGSPEPDPIRNARETFMGHDYARNYTGPLHRYVAFVRFRGPSPGLPA